MDHSGYNVFVTGMSGTGRTTIVKNILEDLAKDKPVPSDWVYVYNFDDPDVPQALELPAGKAKMLKRDMDDLLKTLKREIPEAFNSEDYEQQRMIILNRSHERKHQLLTQLDQKAASVGIQIQSTPAGFQTVVIKDNKPITPEEYEKLSPEEKQAINERLQIVQREINETVRQLVKIDRQAEKDIRLLNEKIATFIVNRHVEELKLEFSEFPQITGYLDRVSQDIITNINDFLSQSKEEVKPGDKILAQSNHFKRYTVNVIVDNSGSKGAPVIYEPNPSYSNLFGRIEKQTIMGAKITDFTMIKGGSLHRANGGYLMTEAYHVLKNPFVYDALKRAIKTREIRIEDFPDLYGLVSLASLRPEPIPLNLKVVLIGWNQIYYALQAYDQDFNKIFKIRADFDYETEATRESVHQYSQFIKKVCQEENLLPFHRTAVREIVYYGHRLVDDKKKLSLRFGSLVSIIREANHFAKKENEPHVSARHVKKAIKEYRYRHSLVEEKIQEMYKREIYRIDTSGMKVGQINGLAVYSLGDHIFGRPNRITAKTYIGSENLINIERKARLSGKIHDKGILILNGFFNSKFGEYMPLNFSASITFEQSYSTVEGDSASSTELYALISCLANVPIKQGIAVTGSVDQNGDIQAIGGVNQKIEGFYAVCKEKGLNGEQGVIIPRSNIENLMLEEEIVKAVREGKFHIWAVDTVEDGLKILTGLDAGHRQKNGKFPRNTIYYMVENRLKSFAKRADEFKKSFGSKRAKEKMAFQQEQNNKEGED